MLCRVLELTVDDLAGPVGSHVTVVLGDVNHVLACGIRPAPAVGRHGILGEDPSIETAASPLPGSSSLRHCRAAQ